MEATNFPTFDENPLNRIIIVLKKPKGVGSNKPPVVSDIQIKACYKTGEIKCIFHYIKTLHNTF